MDTLIDHQHVKRMVEAGLTEQQAEAIASGITDRLATKADFDRLESKIAWMMLVQSIAIIGLVVTMIVNLT